jgi:aminoglycoside/choline kinase family phosphotransferase
LKIFQHVTADREAEPITLDAMVDYIDIRLKQLVDHPLFSQALRRQILKYFEKQRPRIPPSDYTQVRIHADFCPGNVLIQDRQITVIDFNMTQHGSKYHDLAHFYHQLSLLSVKPIYRPSIIGDLQHALLRGYENGLHEGAPLFLLCRIQHAICGMARLVTLRNCPIYERLYNKLVFQRQLQWLNGLVTME